MNPAFLFLSFGLLSWGYLVNSLTLAIGLLAVFAVVQSSIWRWTIAPKQIHRWGDVSTLLIVLILIQVYVLKPVEQPIFILLKCLPIAFAPVLLAQFLSRQQHIPLSTLFYALRKKNHADNKNIDFVLPYAAICIVSAGAANVQDLSYFALATAFFVMVSGFNRPKHSRFWLWLSIVTLAVVSGFFGQKGLRQLHVFVEQQSIQWLSEWHTDPFKEQTAIGDLGELKLSSKIEFRIKADGQILLHQASYDRYLGKTWLASKRVFNTEKPEINSQQPLKRLDVLQQSIGQTVLALPDGTVEIKGLNDAILQYSELGAVKAEAPAKTVSYQIFYTGKRLGEPSRYDLQLPPQHLAWLQQHYQQLKLANLPPKIIAERIKDYFQANFFYSLYLGKESNSDLALKNFMLKTKAGHCEYFAAATVLLLRQAGIPARLATGYSVSEYVPEQDLYLVRRRDAHAWAIAYIDGVWQPVDSTPAQWQQMEADNTNSLWQVLNDAWSNSVFFLQQWQITDAQLWQIKLAILVLILLYVSIRMLRNKYQSSFTSHIVSHVYAGLDSEFYLIEQRLQNTEKARLNNESLQQWVNRLNSPELIQLCQLHYQLRFDPKGLTTEQRQQLRQKVKDLIIANKVSLTD